MTEALEKIIVEQFALARDTIINQAAGDMMTARFSGYKDGKAVFIMLSPFEDDTYSKNIAALMCRKVLAHAGCDAYALTSEVWVAATKNNDPDDRPPSQRPDRQEVVMVYAENADGITHAGLWDIERRDDGRVRKLKRRPDVDGAWFQSLRFGGLLQRGFNA